MGALAALISNAMVWVKGWFTKTFNSADPTIEFSHVLLAIAFAFATYWLDHSLKMSKWQMTATWATCFTTFMTVMFAKGIWGKDGK